MRRPLVFVLLLALLGAGIYMVVTRPVRPHAVSAARPQKKAPSKGAGAARARPATDGGAAAAKKSATRDGGVAKAPPRPLDRTLRVIGLGWDVVAPAIVANGGAGPATRGPFAEAHLDLVVHAADDPRTIEGALARGGSDPTGADVAVLPLPVFVASFERLRALEPEMFLVVGWSRGREGLAGASATTLVRPPASGAVEMTGAPGSAAAAFGLMMLDLAGVDGSRVTLVPPDDLRRSATTMSAVDRGGPGSLRTGSKWLATTAEARRTVPIVAIAPRGLARSHPEALVALARGWLAGVEQLRADVPAAARQVAAIDGAPEAVSILERLGQIEPASLLDNARALGLSGRGAVTLGAVFLRTWGLWRAVNVLTTPAPEAPPLHTNVVVALARGREGAAAGAAPGPTGEARRPQSRVLLAHPVTAGPDELVLQLGLCAGLFEGQSLRVSARGPAAEAAITAARERFDLAPDRVTVGRVRVPAGAGGLIEVLTE